MSEALILTLPAVAAAAPGGATPGAAGGARAGSDASAADSFAAQLERSQAGSTDAQGLSTSPESEPPDESNPEATADALNDILAQWLPSAPPAQPTPSVAAPFGSAAHAAAAPAVDRYEPAPAAKPSTAVVGATTAAWASSAAALARDGEASGLPRHGVAPSVPPAQRDAAARPGTPARGVGDGIDEPSASPVATDRTALPNTDLDPNPVDAAAASSAPLERPAEAAATGTAADATTGVTVQPLEPTVPLAPPTPTPATMAGGRDGAIETMAADAARPARSTDATPSSTERQRPGQATRTGFETMRGAEPATIRSLQAAIATPPGRETSSRGEDEPAPLAANTLAAGPTAGARLASHAEGAATAVPSTLAADAVSANANAAASATHGVVTAAPIVVPAGASTNLATHTDITITTPVQSPQFAEALGVQVSVLARGGLERAELQLNPVSMGPLAVQIMLDAGQAHVHFGSDSAQTRQVVEAGLPALAAALRDAGFTLAGGGVSQHPGDPRHGAAPRAATNFGLRLANAPKDELRPLRSVRTTLGRLDLYA